MKRIILIHSLILATLASTALLARAQWVAYDLGSFGGRSFAYGINDAGTIVGYSTTSGYNDAHAFRYSDVGGMTDLGTLGGSYSIANGINSGGDIVGWGSTAGGDYRASLR